MNKLPMLSITLASFLATNATCAANFNIIPAANYPISKFISPGETVFAYYLIRNNTSSTRTGYKIQVLPASVKQNTTNSSFCPLIMTLAPGSTCTLELQIKAPVQSSFALCKGTSCTTAAVPLNVKKRSALTGVGRYRNTANSIAPLTYTSTDGGVHWTVQSTPLALPADAASGTIAINGLNSVTCDNTTKKHCSAVGYYTNKANGTAPLTYTSTDGGVHWIVQSKPLALPANVASGANASSWLNSVACDSATGTRCRSVGYYKNTANGTVPLTYTSTDGGVHWTVQSTPLALPADAASGANASSILSSVSCGGAAGKQCSSVGYYKNTENGNAPLAYTSTDGGVHWTVQSTPLALPADANSGTNADALLSKVSCDSATGKQCSSVGFYLNNSDYAPLTYTSTDGGVHWTVQSTPLALPEDATGLFSGLSGVTCDGATGKQCSSVGFYQNTANGTAPLTYTSSDGGIHWIVQSTPLALPADAASGTGVLTGLSSVTCDSATGKQCSSVGYYTNTANGTAPLTYTSNDGGTHWTVHSKPLALPADTASSANASSWLSGVK